MPNPYGFVGHGDKSNTDTEPVVQQTCIGHIPKGMWVAARSPLAAGFVFSARLNLKRTYEQSTLRINKQNQQKENPNLDNHSHSQYLAVVYHDSGGIDLVARQNTKSAQKS
jgi:hypothetical protein